MSNDNKDQVSTGTDCLTGVGADSLDDLFKDVHSSTFSLPPLTGGAMSGSLGSITVNTSTTGGGYPPYNSPTTPLAASQYSYNIGAYSWGQTALSGTGHVPTVKVTNTGIDMPEDADIKFGGQSLKTFMKAVSDRLAILQPDPAKLERFEALKQAYEHYKLLEKLCHEEDKKDSK